LQQFSLPIQKGHFMRSNLSPRVLASRLAIAGAFALAALFGATQPVIAQSDTIAAEKPAPEGKPCPDCKTGKTVAATKLPVQGLLPPAPPIRYVPGLEEPLVATGIVREQENKDLDAALEAYKAAPGSAPQGSDFSDFAKPLLAFIDANPESCWNAALWTNLGIG
jgi:hypothetical protein